MPRFINHVDPPELGDCITGVKRSEALGFAGQDVNVHSTSDGVIVGLHWAAGGGWPLFPRADSLPFHELEKHRNKRSPGARIQRVTDMLDAVGPDFVLCLEAKPSPGLEDPKVWDQVSGRNAVAMVIQRYKSAAWERAAIRRMAAAKTAGVPTMLLWRHPIPATSPWWAVIDAVKGAPKTQVIPEGIIRVPLGGMSHDKAREVLKAILAKGGGKPKPRHTKPRTTKPVKHSPPKPPFIGAFHTSAGANKPINRIVIHSTVGPSGPGSARGIASYFQSPRSGGSAHYVVDAGEVVQCVYDGVIAWHAPPNQHSIGVEMCDMPSAVNFLRWKTKNGKAVLDRTAQLVAELCLAYDVPVQRLSVADVRAGKHGICGHTDVSRAFHQSTHWDPGAFPWTLFMSMVKQKVAKLKGVTK